MWCATNCRPSARSISFCMASSAVASLGHSRSTRTANRSARPCSRWRSPMRTVDSGWLAAFSSMTLVLACASAARAQVVRIDIVSRELANGGQPIGKAGAYEILHGRAHGEVDPADPRNRIIQDLQLAPRNGRGKVEYVATFALAKPIDLKKSSGVLVYQVVNRGTGAATPSVDGHISLVSGWQGDVIPTAANQTIAVPVAKHKDGSPITGPVIARFYNVAPGTT